MNRAVRRLGAVLVLCFLALFVQLNLVQVYRAEELREHPANTREIQREFNRERGLILSAEGDVIAESVEVATGPFDRERRYPEGELFGHITGHFSFLYGATGVERAFNDELTGATFGQQLRGFRDLFVDREIVGDVHLSVHTSLQRVARDALGDRAGSVVALDPRTGEVLAMWSNPSYDPSLLSTTDLEASTAAWDLLQEATGNPMRAGAYQERYFPGSTFKVVTAGAGLAQGTVSADDPRYPNERSWTPPTTNLAIGNFGGSACGGTLHDILRVSCNSSFARMAVETIGPEGMVDGAEAWGFNAAPPFDLPDPAESLFPTEFERDLPRLAQTGIGQNDVASTPLLMAMVAATVANEGEMMRPTVVREVRDRRGDVIDRGEPQRWQSPLDPGDAAVLRDAMIEVVESGTATSLATPGVEVGGKTGTAQLGTDPPRSHTWMIGFAGPAGDAQVAVAAVVLDQPAATDATGGRVAGPIVKAMIDATLALRDDGADG